MKRILLLPLVLLAMALSACESGDNEDVGNTAPSESTNTENNNQTSLSMKITVGTRTITAKMEDNAAARDLLSRLPLEITLEDFNNTAEKIFYPSPTLNTDGIKVGCTPVSGDIAIYIPWQNVAIFCKSGAYSNDLIKIGHIDANGIEALQMGGDFNVKFER